MTTPGKFLTLASICAFASLASAAQAAESPFVQQIPGGLSTNSPNFGPLLKSPAPTTSTPSFSAPGAAAAPLFAAPHPNTNVALTVEIGNNNHVFQIQQGTGDQSDVGIIGGNNNNVGVIQAGNNLQSNLWLLGTKGMNVEVLQPNHSAPINMAIIHVPAGTVIIPHL